jgi:hypothetical protein
VKVRVLGDTVPSWLLPHLEGHQVTVGSTARAEVKRELWPDPPDVWPFMPGMNAGRRTGVYRHGTVSTYTRGCRCDACREQWRVYRLDRRLAGID